MASFGRSGSHCFRRTKKTRRNKPGQRYCSFAYPLPIGRHHARELKHQIDLLHFLGSHPPRKPGFPVFHFVSFSTSVVVWIDPKTTSTLLPLLSRVSKVRNEIGLRHRTGRGLLVSEKVSLSVCPRFFVCCQCLPPPPHLSTYPVMDGIERPSDWQQSSLYLCSSAFVSSYEMHMHFTFMSLVNFFKYSKYESKIWVSINDQRYF